MQKIKSHNHLKQSPTEERENLVINTDIESQHYKIIIPDNITEANFLPNSQLEFSY